MSKVEYPKFLYHKAEPPKIVYSIEEHKEIGKEWREMPFEKSEISFEKESELESETESNSKGLDESELKANKKDRKTQRVR